MDTIAITFPKVKVNTEIKDLTFDSIEDMIFEIYHKCFTSKVINVIFYLKKILKIKL